MLHPGVSISVVIPVFNEQEGIDPLYERLQPVLSGLGCDYEVVFVDDGSSDGTMARLRSLNETDQRVKAVSLSRNFGKEIAVAAGLKYANGDAVVLMDGDLQHPPEAIPAFVDRWRKGFDVVYGERMDRNDETPMRRIFSQGFYVLFDLLSGTQLHRNAGDFRLFSRRAVDALNRLGERARFNKGLFAWIGFKSTGLPFEVEDRVDGGGSRWSLRRLLHFAIDGIASFSTIPLRIWSYVGLAVSLFAFGYAAIFLIKTLILGSGVAGFPTLIISIMMFSGIQLMSLGILGEYLGRIYAEVKARPLFLVADEVGMGARPKTEGDGGEDGEGKSYPGSAGDRHG
ncbi:MAG: glycosyltransferase family 2 protein [Alphaproteobacteria bacterium]|nr:glycosyltransferase family 2 protein [Alphaproteobacteria bacterium]